MRLRVDVELGLEAVGERDDVADLVDPAALGERPQRLEAAVVDLELLLGADLRRARLDRQGRAPGAPPHADLDAVGGDREVALLDPLARGQAVRLPAGQELALDPTPGGDGIRMEHYGPCHRPRSISCCPPGSTARMRSPCSSRGCGSKSATPAPATGCCSTASTGG